MKKVLAVIGVLCVIALLVFIGTGGLIDDDHYHVVRHRDGRHWKLNGEPYGHGWNSGLPGQDGGYYWWKDPNGFTTKVRKSGCIVERID